MARKLLISSKRIIVRLVRLAVITILLTTAICVFINNHITLGWFALNKNVTANGISVTVQEEESYSIVDYTVYRYDQDDNLQTDRNALMRQYDTIFTERNVHNAIVIKIDVEGLNAGDVFGVSILSTPISDRDSQRYISDIVSLRASAMSIYPTDDIYDTVTAELSNDIYPAKTFRTIDAGNVSARTTVVTFDSLTMTENGSIYILMDYDPNLIGQVEVEFGDQSSMSIEYNGNITGIELFGN